MLTRYWGKTYWQTFGIILVFWVLATLIEPGSDSATTVGFPIPFYSYGGFWDCRAGNCTVFMWYLLVYDLLVLIGFPHFLGWLEETKGRQFSIVSKILLVIMVFIVTWGVALPFFVK